jgi:transmembrane sensor
MVQPGRDALTLNAGDSASARGDGSVVRGKIDPGAVGSWRVGMLGFEGQRLGDVAATIERMYGIHVTMDRRLSHRPFTGMVRFTGAADRDVPHLAALIGAAWRRDGERWILSDGISAPR